MVYDTNIHGKWNIKSGRNLILKNANKVWYKMFFIIMQCTVLASFTKTTTAY